jgi:hypothetical protein
VASTDDVFKLLNDVNGITLKRMEDKTDAINAVTLKRMEQSILALHVRVDQIHAKVGASGAPPPPPN